MNSKGQNWNPTKFEAGMYRRSNLQDQSFAGTLESYGMTKLEP